MEEKRTKGYKTIGLKALMSWIKIGGGGILFSLICIVTACMLLGSNLGIYDGVSKLGVLSDKPWASTLLVVSIIFILLYVVIANKHALQTLISQVYYNKLTDFIIPKVDSYVIKITNMQPEWLKGVTDYAAVKLQLMDELRKDSSINKVQRTALNFGFKKLKLNKRDFQQEENSFTSIVIEKVRNSLSKVKEPSILLPGILFGAQLLLLVLAIVLN